MTFWSVFSIVLLIVMFLMQSSYEGRISAKNEQIGELMVELHRCERDKK